jgi:hypothetical protein
MPAVDRLIWRTSTFSSNGTTCVEVALTDTVTALRDTKHRAGGYLTMPAAYGHTFITAVKSGQFHR